MDDITVLWDRLAHRAEELNSLTDQFNASVAALETKLSALHIGVDAWVPVPESNSWEFGYAKLNGKWGFALRSFAASPVVCGTNEIKFCEGPRAIRLQAVVALPDLFDALVIEANRLCSALCNASKYFSR